LGGDEWGEYAERFREFSKRLERLRDYIRSIALDEMSEAKAYRDMALSCRDPEARYRLAMIAFDSMLHREIAWGLLRLVESARMFFNELALTPRPATPIAEVLRLVEIHRSIEELAQAGYRDLAEMAPKNTGLRKLFEFLASEEEKHFRMVREILEVLRKRAGEGGGS